MGWSLGFDSRCGGRDIGYGVPAYCDHPGCMKEINRGLSCVCGGDPYGGEKGCGLFFCSEHLFGYGPELCKRCSDGKNPFKPTPDHPRWIKHKLTDRSWARWRKENQALVIAMRKSLRISNKKEKL